MEEVATVIQETAENWSDITKLLRNTRSGGTRMRGSNVSHTIFQIYPPDTDPSRLLLHCQYEPISGWALNILLQQYEVSKANAAADFYYKLSGMPEAAALRGHLFERQVLSHLCGIDKKSRVSDTWVNRLQPNNVELSWTHSKYHLSGLGIFLRNHQSSSEPRATAFGPFISQLSGR
jgi:hypothetical protein